MVLYLFYYFCSQRHTNIQIFTNVPKRRVARVNLYKVSAKKVAIGYLSITGGCVIRKSSIVLQVASSVSATRIKFPNEHLGVATASAVKIRSNFRFIS